MPEHVVIDAKDLYYRELNEQIREAVRGGAKKIVIDNCMGHRYIGNSIDAPGVEIVVNGTAGPDMATFMRGPTITVNGNAQDGVGNTMDEGLIIIHGLAGDVLGYAMRGGRVFVKRDVGYRVGIHMKSYMDKQPVIVVGGKAGDFLGEYMAGGAIILLGMDTEKPNAPITGRSLGTGMHGGVMYIRGGVPDYQLGHGLHSQELDEDDMAFLKTQLADYCEVFGLSLDEVLAEKFIKVKPYTHRPYGNMYVHTN